MRQRVENRKFHGRNAHLCHNTAVDELDKRVNDALRMHHDIDAIIRQVEKKMRLDYFERLVGEGRTIDRDLATHLPRRMSQGIFDGGLCQLILAPTAKRST